MKEDGENGAEKKMFQLINKSPGSGDFKTFSELSILQHSTAWWALSPS